MLNDVLTGITYDMRCPSDIPRRTILFATYYQVVAYLRSVKILAVHPSNRCTWSVAQVFLRTLACGDHPVLQFPCLCLFVFAFFLVLLVRVVYPAGECTEAEC